MIKHLLFLIVLFWVGRFASYGQTGQAMPRLASAELEGIWKGALPNASGEAALSFSVVALTGGRYFAALDAPVQQLVRVPVEVRQASGSDSVRLLVPTTKGRLLSRLSLDGQELSGVWYQAGRRTPLVLRRTPLPNLLDPATRPAPPYQEEEVKVSNFQARLHLAGTLTMPAGAGPYPAVVLVSDLGAQNRDGQAADNLTDFRLLGALADLLTRRGFAVLRLDDRGVGQSEGHDSQTTPVQRAGDVQAALNYLRTRPEIDLLHLGLIGHGEGASVALLVAAQPLPPAFVIGLGAYGLTGYDTQLQQLEDNLSTRKLPAGQQAERLHRQATLYDFIRYSTNLSQTHVIVSNLLCQNDNATTPAVAQQLASSLLTPWHRAFLVFNPLESLAQVQCPVLLLSGQTDELAPPALHLAELKHELRTNGNRQVAVRRLPGVNHLMQPPKIQWTMLDGEMRPVLAPAAAEVLSRWLTEQVGGPLAKAKK